MYRVYGDELKQRTEIAYDWRLRKKKVVNVVDLGQKPVVHVADKNSALTPEFFSKTRISGSRRAIVELLQGEGPLELSEVARRSELPIKECNKILKNSPEFHIVSSVWHIDSEWLEWAIAQKQAAYGMTLEEEIHEYLKEHGPSLASTIARDLGKNRDNALRKVLKKKFVLAQEAKMAKWAGIPGADKSVYAPVTTAHKMTVLFQEDNTPKTTSELSEILEIDYRTIALALKSATGTHFVRVQKRQYELYDIKR